MTDTEEQPRELAAQALFAQAFPGHSWDDTSDLERHRYRATADAVLAAVTPVIRRQVAEEIAETLRLVSKGRASYLAAYRSFDGWDESRVILDAEVVSYATAAELAEGATAPLYSLLPSWMRPGDALKTAAAIARSHSTQPTEEETNGA